MNPCTCRDCMDIATVPGLCWECEDAQCLPYDTCTAGKPSHTFDCQRTDTYGPRPGTYAWGAS